jgi:hypothetical protein
LGYAFPQGKDKCILSMLLSPKAFRYINPFFKLLSRFQCIEK